MVIFSRRIQEVRQWFDNIIFLWFIVIPDISFHSHVTTIISFLFFCGEEIYFFICRRILYLYWYTSLTFGKFYWDLSSENEWSIMYEKRHRSVLWIFVLWIVTWCISDDSFDFFHKVVCSSSGYMNWKRYQEFSNSFWILLLRFEVCRSFMSPYRIFFFFVLVSFIISIFVDQ